MCGGGAGGGGGGVYVSFFIFDRHVLTRPPPRNSLPSSHTAPPVDITVRARCLVQISFLVKWGRCVCVGGGG